MRWQIAQYIFCDQQQTLTSNEGSKQLEPMMVELLSFFCQHPDEIVSKDQLIEKVWLGRIVSDNAVSKLITKLRKVFSDDVRQPKFIATFPKKGYKFIVDVTVINESTEQNPTLDKSIVANLELNNDVSLKGTQKRVSNHSNKLASQTNSLTKLSVLILCFFCVTFLYIWWDKALNKSVVATTYAKAITTEMGDELFPAFSPDGSRVAYMLEVDNRIRLMIKDVVTERTIEVSHGSDIGVGPGNWSSDGKFIVYLAATPNQCQYFKRSIEGLILGEPELIHNCPAGSYGTIMFSHDNERLIYTESEDRSSPYSLFEINTKSGVKKRLNQPELFIGGNSQFDLHPTENKLLISSPDKQQWEGFYSLDLDTEELTLLFKLDAYICCGIWDHAGERVVLMGEYPAYQMLSYNLSGKDIKVVHSGSRLISRPRRHSNGIDYLFSSERENRDVKLLNIDSKVSKTVANTSVDERLASFNHDASKIAYIGLSTGNEEVWVVDTITNERIKLTSFNDSRHYIELLWRKGDKELIALTLNEIHLIDAQTGTFKRLKIPQTEIRAISFKDADTLSYSILKNGQWRVHWYQLNNHSISMAEPKWQYIQYSDRGSDILWLDQQDNLYVGDHKKKVNNLYFSGSNLLNGRQFNLKKYQSSWLWFERVKTGQILKFSEIDNQLTVILNTAVGRFDYHDNKLLHGTIKQMNADIYQTQQLAQ